MALLAGVTFAKVFAQGAEHETATSTLAFLCKVALIG